MMTLFCPMPWIVWALPWVSFPFLTHLKERDKWFYGLCIISVTAQGVALLLKKEKNSFLFRKC